MTPTSTLTILGQSLRTVLRRWPVLLTIQGLTVLLVLPVVLAFRSTLSYAFDESNVVERMLSGFDHITYEDFRAQQMWVVEFLRRTVGPLALVSTILHGVLGAGVVVAMAGEGTVAEFLKATGRFMTRSLRLVLYAVLIGGPFLLVWALAMASVWSVMTAGDAMESDYLWAAISVVVLFLLPVVILSLATEYGRVLIVREDRRQVFRSFMEGFVFVARHPVRMAAQHGTILAAMVLLVLVYWSIDQVVEMTSTAGILAMFVIQQASILARVGVRVWQTASAARLVDALTPEVPASVRTSPEPAPSVPVDVILGASHPAAPSKPASRNRSTVRSTKRPARKPVRRPRGR
jgi:hypothetical protein